MCMITCVNMHITTINEKRGHDFERKQRGVEFGEFGKRRKKMV